MSPTKINPAPASSSTTHWPQVFTLWLCGVLAAMQFSKISFAFQTLQASYDSSATAMGWILSTVGTVGLLLGVTAGLCAPAIGYRRLLLLGMGLGAVLAALQALILPFELLWLTRLFEGFSQLAVVVAAPVLIIRQSARRHHSIVMGLWSTFVSVAFAVTAAGGGWLLAHFHLTGLFLVHALGMAMMFGLVLVLLPKDAAQAPPWPTLAALPMLHVRLYQHWVTALPGLCFFCYTSSAIALLTFLPQYAGADRAWVAVILPFAAISGTFSAGWLAQSLVAPRRLVLGAFTAMALVGLGLGVCLMIGVSIAPVAVLLTYTVGLAGGSSFALIPYLSREPAVQARANGAVAQMGNLGSTLGPPLFALMISAFGGPGLVLPVVGFALMGCVLMVMSSGASNQPPSV
jgi:MFS family permease